MNRNGGVANHAAQMLALYQGGSTLQEIADEYGCSRERVRQVISSLDGYSPHGGQRKREARATRLREAHERITRGESTPAEEAEALGYKNASSLRVVFWRLGLPPQRRPPPEHGTYARYRHHRCRCQDCRNAARESRLDQYKREPPQHGTPSGYQNYRCRCAPCKQAWRAYTREARAAKRQAKEPTV